MRLEDWQKFIESQFLEDISESQADAPLKTPAETLAEASTPTVILEEPTAPAFTPAVTVAELAIEAPTPAISGVEPVVRPLAAPDHSGSQQRSVSTVADSGSGNRNATTNSPPAFTTFGDIPNFEAAVPDIKDYLTWRRPQPNTDFIKDPAQPAAYPDEIPTDTETKRATVQGSRITPSRARMGRNAPSTIDEATLSKAELWAKVPKYVETLLALQRIEENQEIAQSSYKKPFTEKRQELIERLLDPVLSLEETARLLNVCPTTVRRYTNKGLLTYYRKEVERTDRQNGKEDKETRQRRFRLSDILMFLEKQQAAVDADREVDTGRSRVSRSITEATKQMGTTIDSSDALPHKDAAETT